jgi:hypothetical protein
VEKSYPGTGRQIAPEAAWGARGRKGVSHVTPESGDFCVNFTPEGLTPRRPGHGFAERLFLEQDHGQERNRQRAGDGEKNRLEGVD